MPPAVPILLAWTGDAIPGPELRIRAASREGLMDLLNLSPHALEYWLGGVIALGLAAYLVYALIYPERF